jgi:CDP-4-dehydro-6-deoxyglucose reductase
MKITLKCGTNFEACDRSSILDDAIENNVFLSHSCRTGQCDSCKTKVISGETAVIRPEIALKQKDIDAGYILTCCRSPLSDLTLDAINLKKFSSIKKVRIPAKIRKLNKVTSSLLILELQLHPESNFKFIPGQYIDLSRSNIKRSYSIMSFDEQNKVLRLFIKNYIGGAMSQYLFEESKVGDLLVIFGPHGTFCFENSERAGSNLFFATGTGIAPFISILNDLEARNIKAIIHLFWGNRYADEFLELQDFKSNDLKIYRALSQETREGFYNGYIQDLFSSVGYEDNSISPYICGSKDMIECVQNRLRESGHNGIIATDAFVSHNEG